MSVPTSNQRTWVLVVGVVVVVVAGLFAWILLAPGPSTSPAGTASVYGHAGIVNRGEGGEYGTASVYSHAYAISSGPSTTTPAVNVRSGSEVFLFVGYVNSEIGGGSVLSITDSLGDVYNPVLSSGSAQNHTEALYTAGPVPSAGSLRVNVTFGGGTSTMGGSVALVDVVATVGAPKVDVVYTEAGVGAVASINVSTTLPDDLLLLGVSGSQSAAPLAPASDETLLDTAGGTTGPSTEGEGFGTFSAPESGPRTELSATLASPTEWAAIGVGIYSFAASGISGTTTTPMFPVGANSLVYLFVGYVNTEIGGGNISSISDTLGDYYTLVVSTGFEQNHTESLYVSSVIPTSGTLDVTVAFTGGDTVMGGAVAAVDVVASSGSPEVDVFSTASGTWSGIASVTVTTNRPGDLLLFGVAGMGRDAPFTGTGNETLLDTGTNTSGPFYDGTGYGTFSEPEGTSSSQLSATLSTPAEWSAIGIGIYVAPPSTASAVGFTLGPTAAFGATALVAAELRRP